MSRRVEIPTRDAGRIYGGGNTAIDAARTAKRLGAEETPIIYRRTREEIFTHAFEADEALEEGSKIHCFRMISESDGTEFKVEVTELDESGYPQPTSSRSPDSSPWIGGGNKVL